jgi:hypothetical protein
VDYQLFPNGKSTPIIGIDDLRSRLIKEGLYALETTTFQDDDVSIVMFDDNSLDLLIKFAKANRIKTAFYECVFTEQDEHLITEEMIETYHCEITDGIEAEIETYNDMVSDIDYSSPAALLVFVRCNERIFGISMTDPEMDTVLSNSPEDILEWLIEDSDEVCAICESNDYYLHETKDGQLICENCACGARIDYSQIENCRLPYIESKLAAYSRRNSSEITARPTTPVNTATDIDDEEVEDTAGNEYGYKCYCTICDNDAGHGYFLTKDQHVVCISCIRETDFKSASIHKYSRHEIKKRIFFFSDNKDTYGKLPCANCNIDVHTYSTHYSTLDKQPICKACAGLTGINPTHIKGHDLENIKARITANIIPGHWRSNDGPSSCQNAIIYLDGNRYQGNLSEGQPHGKGILCYSDGEEYRGEFKNGVIEGEGTFTYLNGDTYRGRFKNGLRNGRGVLYYVNGDRYEGEFRDDDVVKGRGKTIPKNVDIGIKKITPWDLRNNPSSDINWNDQNW